MNLLAIALGGALGALSRYGVYQWLPLNDGRQFPLGTFVVNLLGSFLIGVFYVLILEKMALSSEWRGLISVGFLGAFTTFSTFSLETVLLLQHGETLRALLYIVFSVIFCIVATLVAILLTRLL